MSLLAKLADKLILCPSTKAIDSKDSVREVVWAQEGIEIETYVSTWGDFESTSIPETEKLVVLKFPGTGGRAERGTVHPAELLVGDDPHSTIKAAQVWTLNHRGYGQSTGPASLANFTSTIDHFWDFIEQRFRGTKKLATGNSLGCMSALYLSHYRNIDAIMIRNPPPLARLISDRPRYNAWNFGFGKRIGNQVPEKLDSLRNAKHSNCPALFVSSEKDRVVPIKYQLEIADAYHGPNRQFVIQGADHHHRIPEHQESQYLEAVRWLHENLASRN